MKTWLAIALMATATEVFACDDSSRIRVHFSNCTLSKPISVRVGEKSIVKLSPIGDSNTDFEGVSTDGGRFNKNFEIEVVSDDPPICCKAEPKVIPFSMWSDECYVDYIVSCDARPPTWTMTTQGAGGFQFQFRPSHPNPLERTCVPDDVLVGDKTVSNLGLNDVVHFTLLRDKAPLLSDLRVKFTDFDGKKKPFTRTILEKCLRDEVKKLSKKGNVQANFLVEDQVNKLKPLLPEDGFVVVKE